MAEEGMPALSVFSPEPQPKKKSSHIRTYFHLSRHNVTKKTLISNDTLQGWLKALK